MIILHSLKGTAIAINAGLIERIEGENETHVMLVTGTSYLVQESVEEVVRLHREDRAIVQAQAGSQLIGKTQEEPQLPAGVLSLRLVGEPDGRHGREER